MKRIIVIFLCVVLLPIVVSRFITAPSPSSTDNDIVESKLKQDNSETAEPDGKSNAAITQDPEIQDPEIHIAELIDNEELIRKIDPILANLNRAALNLEIVNDETLSHFSEHCQIRDVISVEDARKEFVAGSHRREINTGVTNEPPNDNQAPAIWTELLKRVEYCENAKFYAVNVSDRRSLPESFVTTVGFKSLAKSKSGSWLAISTTGKLKWESDGQKEWKIADWDFEEFNLIESSRRLFEDVSKSVFSPADYQRTQHSQHYEILVNAIRNGPKAFVDKRQNDFFPRGGTTGRHPSISIVDIDNDGWDDFYMVEQWRKNMLYRNRGDGTFEEVASEYDLDLPGYGSSALFADFDNDGDQDLFLGRSLKRSMYLENVDGKFVDRTQLMFSFTLPFLVTAVSASDFNGDGLLDIYLSTYGFPALPYSKWGKEFLNPKDRQHVLSLIRSDEYQRFINAAGPKNLLLENRGDRFEISKFNSQVAVWANSFQGTWADYDNDGDPDLYVANDFARDYLFRNDQEEGFADVTLEVGDDTMTGFGMGAAWGDYDLDGQLDLYVSNMYSKAGIRITEHFGQLDKRFRRSADGNRLYRNSENRLQLVSANQGPGLNVHKAGWSWGGQFLDVNNDGFLELYVCNGYFTAPEMFATDLDL